MSKGVKSIRDLKIPLLILALLILGLIATYYFFPARSPDAQQSESSKRIDVLSLNPDDILFVSVAKNGRESYRINRTADGDIVAIWAYDDPSGLYSEHIFSQELLDIFVREVSSVVSLKAIETDSSGFDQFGLLNPETELRYGLSTGEEVHLRIGSKTADGLSSYLCLGNEGPVYVVPEEKAEVFRYVAKDFFDRRVLDYSARKISELSFFRRADDLSVTARPEVHVTSAGDTTQWILTDPVEFRSGEIFDRLMNSLLTMQADEYVTSSTDDLAQYGLSAPEYEFLIEEPGGIETKAYLSKEMSGKYYGYTDKIPGIFQISSDRINGLDVSLIDCYFPYPVQSTIDEIKSIRAALPEGEFLAEIEVPEGVLITDSEASVFVNRRSAKVTDSSGNSYFMILFLSVMEIRFAEVAKNPPASDDIAVSIQIVGENNQMNTIELMPVGEDLFALYLNGLYTGFRVTSDELYSDRLTEPGVWYAYELLSDALDGQINGKYDIPVQ